MLSYSEIKERKYIIFEGEPWEVLSSQVTRKQSNKPVNRTKIKNLISGRVIDQTFHVSDKVDEADIGERDIQYIYNAKEEYWFHEKNDKSARFILPEHIIGEKAKFMKENSVVNALTFIDKGDNERIISIRLPIKVALEVKEAPPNIKGNTASGGNKPVTLETGVVINVPLFIEAGNIITVNTENGQYVDRVGK